jgi:4-amino-4-deoxy-L-arabinose transferase-like glycosyltransferase
VGDAAKVEVGPDEGGNDSSADLDLAVPAAPFPWVVWLDRIALVALAVLAVGVRFWTRSPLWLDESLSVNIARLPMGDIAEWLRHDGHPPLYYWMLHGWIEVFGDSDTAVRALSGLFGVALIPLVWLAGNRIAGRREAWAAVVVLAVNPFAIRYATETRMYAMVMVLALAAWLLADDALRRPTLPRLIGLGLCTGLALLSHYWVMWLVGAVGLLLVANIVRTHRAGQVPRRNRTVRVLAAMALGSLLFVPWLPSLLYQSKHTGTPWAGAVRPATVVVTSLQEMGGGPVGESLLLSLVFFALILLGICGRALDGRRIELDLTVQPEARRLVATVGVTLAIAEVVAYATNSAFAARYIAPVFPLLVLLIGMGISRFASGVWFRLVLAAVVACSMVGIGRNITQPRVQSREIVDTVAATAGPDDSIVAYCPDQLGPAVSREMPDAYEQVAYPRFQEPDFVDWVDYSERLAEVEPEAFAGELLDRADDRHIFLVWKNDYITHTGTCERIINELSRSRPTGQQVVAADAEIFEGASLHHFPPTPEAEAPEN